MGKPTRRDFLKLVGAGAGVALLGGCAQGIDEQAVTAEGPTTPTGTPLPTSQPTVTPEATPMIRGTGTPTRTPDPRKLCFVLWDHQLAKYNFMPRNPNVPLPETCPLYSGATNTLTPEWVAYWKGILRLVNPDMTEQRFEGAWESLVAQDRAFTNGTGPLSDKFAIHSITCGGATHEMVTGVPEGRYMRIHTLNSKKPVPPVPSKVDDLDITRHFFATTGSNVRLADGTYAVYGFPQFDNCIVPLISPDDTDLIDLTRIRVVQNIMRPFHTEVGDDKDVIVTPTG